MVLHCYLLIFVVATANLTVSQALFSLDLDPKLSKRHFEVQINVNVASHLKGYD